jgi:hypothetical protein
VSNDVIKITVAELVNGWEVRAEYLGGAAKTFRQFGAPEDTKQHSFERASVVAQQWAHQSKLHSFLVEFLPERDRQERWYTISSIVAWVNEQIEGHKRYSPEWAAYKNAHDALEYCYEVKHAQELIDRLQVFAQPFIEEDAGEIPEPMKVFYAAYLATIGMIETRIEQLATQERGFEDAPNS